MTDRPSQWSEKIPDALSGERIDRVVSMLTDLSRAEVADLVATGSVCIGDRVVSTRSTRVSAGDELHVDLSRRVVAELGVFGEADISVPVVRVDDQIIVVNKPPRLVVHPGAGNDHGTMIQGLLATYPDLAGVGDPMRPGVVHRLDRGTSGLLVVARTQEAYESLVGQLSARTVDRRYLALVWGHLNPPRGMVDAPIGRSRRDPTRMTVSAQGKEARTTYETRQVFSDPIEATLVSCKLDTGRTHQIRVHMAAISRPVVGDHRYGGVRRTFSTTRPFLHAAELSFDHPGTNERMSFTAALPDDLQAVLARLS
ncbi:MAG: RluA family pseudouridine synthase [Actinobacteria bacterium]|nr:RluA family pseudouridine synthase [Actinomycetota bacterium]